jgi:hypothetical protein
MVSDLEQVIEQLHSDGVKFVTSQLVQIGSAMHYRKGCLVKDPSGNAMLLIET